MAANSYGVVTINGKQYMEREQTFPFQYNLAPGNNNGVVNQANLVLPGTANFWLKSLTREIIQNGASASKRFLFRLGNSDGSTWYQSAGNGGTTDSVIDTLLFGNGQFPFVLNPYIFYTANSSIKMMITDIANDTYSIYFAFRGSYLLPLS